MAFRTHNSTTNEMQVKGIPQLRGHQTSSVLADIGNRLQCRNMEIEPALPLKPSNVLNAVRKPLKNFENEVFSSTQALNKDTTNNATSKHVEENKLWHKEKASYSSDLYNIQDRDKQYTNNVNFLEEYEKDIFEYLRSLEVKCPLRPNFLHGTVTPRMRLILVDWLFEVHGQFSLQSETLFLAVSIIDRYLQKVCVMDKKKIQLLGAASLFMASKYEEIYPPEISNFVFICSNIYTKKEILKMEMQIMRTLNFFIGYPLSVHFLRRYSRACSLDEVTYTLAKYFHEMCLLEYELCHFSPSRLAAAALYLALWLRRKNDEHDVWTETLVYCSQYKPKDIVYIVEKIVFAVINIKNSKYQAISEKYSRSKYLKVSSLPEVSPLYLKRIMKLP